MRHGCCCGLDGVDIDSLDVVVVVDSLDVAVDNLVDVVVVAVSSPFSGYVVLTYLRG